MAQASPLNYKDPGASPARLNEVIKRKLYGIQERLPNSLSASLSELEQIQTFKKYPRQSAGVQVSRGKEGRGERRLQNIARRTKNLIISQLRLV